MEERALYTVAVFQDADQAGAGLLALVADGFPTAALSTLAPATDTSASMIERVFGAEPVALDIRGLGAVHANGVVVDRLQGDDAALTTRGLAATASRLGFQVHDGRIFEQLVARGGVLVAVATAPRAADALALLHAYGGGNAAIGAWAGRL